MSDIPFEQVFSRLNNGLVVCLEKTIYSLSNHESATYLDCRGENAFLSKSYPVSEFERSFLEGFSDKIEEKLESKMPTLSKKALLETVTSRFLDSRDFHKKIDYISSVLEVFDAFVRPYLKTDKSLVPKELLSQLMQAKTHAGIEGLLSQINDKNCFFTKHVYDSDFLCHNGTFFALSTSPGSSEVSVINNGLHYSPGEEFLDLEGLKQKSIGFENHVDFLMNRASIMFRNAVTSNLRSSDSFVKGVLKGEALFEEKGIGYTEIGQRHFVYVKLQPFLLYEPKNGKLYKFPDCRLALEFASPIEFSKIPVVLEAYTHPTLMKVNQPLQPICYGGTKSAKSDFIYAVSNPNFSLGQRASRALNMLYKLFCEEYEGTGAEWHNIQKNISDYNEYNPQKDGIIKIGNEKCVQSQDSKQQLLAMVRSLL